MTHIYVGNINHHWFRWWLVPWTAPSHYLNQCWNIDNWTPGNKLQWNFKRNSFIFIEENTFEMSSAKCSFRLGLNVLSKTLAERSPSSPVSVKALCLFGPNLLSIPILDFYFHGFHSSLHISYMYWTHFWTPWPLVMVEVSLVKIPSDECHWSLLMINQHWFR